jgi:type II secretory ATPase GspE/PulE/Tfp pilus assembly ATPase PilB-like protein
MPNEPSNSQEIPQRLAALLNGAVAQGASDLHIEPTAQAAEIRFRIDGMLLTVDRVGAEVGRALVGRLMVLAQLLTYRLDVPQEGRLSFTPQVRPEHPLELRLAVMPTLHGLRAAVRLPAELIQPGSLQELGLPHSVLTGLTRFAQSDCGMLVLTGPAGSGKTTTIYGLLRHIAQTQPGLSLIALEDPIERDIPGVTQIEVKPFGELTYERALRSILRQDPQVLMLGEIRDAATASLALQAALSGHRLICTLHAADPAGAISRLLEMGNEPYQVTSALFGVVAQRLLRRGRGEAYRGRVPVAEWVEIDSPLRSAILARADADMLRADYAKQPGYQSMRAAARQLVSAGLTDAAEVGRVLGQTRGP